MSSARLLVAAAVLAGLGGVVWWSNEQQAAKEGQPNPDAPPKILTVNEEGLRRIEIRHRGEDAAAVLTRDDGGKWKIVEPEPLEADNGAVAALTSAASNLASDRVVSETTTDLPSYGLEPAVVSITFTLDDGSTKHLRIGEETADRGAIYAAVDGDPRLFTMASFSKTTFDKRAADLREKHLLVFDSDKLSSVELSVPGKPVVGFGRTGDSTWQIVKPRPMRADGFQVEELIRVVHDAQMDPAMDPKEAESKFRSGNAVASVKLALGESTMTLDVREAGGEFFARSSALPGAYKVSLDTGQGVAKSLDDFRNKKLFDFGFDEPSRIEVTDKGAARTIEKQEDKWVSDGQTMDSLSVQNLIDKLRALSASSFDDATFTSAEITIRVVSKNGERIETVELAPLASRFLARRADGNTLYLVDTAAIEDLRSALNGVREPPPPGEGKAESGK